MKRLPISLTVLTLSLCLRPAAVSAETPAAAPLTLDQLAKLFKQLGYDVKPLKNARGEPIGFEGIYTYTSSAVSFQFPFRAILTGDGSTVWLTVPLAKVKDVDGIPPALFLKLLSANRRIGPAFFTYSDDDCELYLYLPAYGLGLTAGGLAQQLEQLARNWWATKDMWDTESWTVKPAPTPAPKK